MENRPTYRELWDRVQAADDWACNGGFQDSDCRFCQEVVTTLEEAPSPVHNVVTSMQSAIPANSGTPTLESGWDLIGHHHPSRPRGRGSCPRTPDVQRSESLPDG